MTSYNFKNRLRITLTDVKGSRSFSVPVYFKKLFTIAVFVTLTTLVFSSVSNVYLYFNRTDTLQVNRALLNRLTDVEQQYRQLKDNMDEVGDVVASLESENLNKEFETSNVSFTNADLNFWDNTDTVERVKKLASYIETSDENFRELDTRVDKIVEVFDLDVGPRKSSDSLNDVIALASLSAQQESLIFDNLPVGYPTESKVITSSFGYRQHPLKKRRSFHRGADLRSRIGQSIVSTADGVVSKAEYNSGSGNHIVIQHNYGFETVYAHLSKLHVKPGDIVSRGELIGLSGNTGASSAPHLHYEIRYLTQSLDPQVFMDLKFGQSERLTKIGEVKWDSLISLMGKRSTHQTLQLSQLEQKYQAR